MTKIKKPDSKIKVLLSKYLKTDAMLKKQIEKEGESAKYGPYGTKEILRLHKIRDVLVVSAVPAMAVLTYFLLPPLGLLYTAILAASIPFVFHMGYKAYEMQTKVRQLTDTFEDSRMTGQKTNESEIARHLLSATRQKPHEYYLTTMNFGVGAPFLTGTIANLFYGMCPKTMVFAFAPMAIAFILGLMLDLNFKKAEKRYLPKPEDLANGTYS